MVPGAIDEVTVIDALLERDSGDNQSPLIHPEDAHVHKATSPYCSGPCRCRGAPPVSVRAPQERCTRGRRVQESVPHTASLPSTLGTPQVRQWAVQRLASAGLCIHVTTTAPGRF